jgi:Leucine-rich repeat (LRR) protein
LARMSQLRELNLRGSRVTDAGLAQLQGLKNLKTLGLQNTKATKAGAEQLKTSLPNCRIVISGDKK